MIVNYAMRYTAPAKHLAYVDTHEYTLYLKAHYLYVASEIGWSRAAPKTLRVYT